MKQNKRIVKNKNKKQLAKDTLKKTVYALDNVVDWDVLLPRSGRPDMRNKKQSRHTLQTINRVINELREHNALKVLSGKPSSFRKMRKSNLRRDVIAETATEPYFKGIFSPNPNVDIVVRRNVDGGVEIERSFKGAPFMSMTPTTFDTTKIRNEDDLKKELFKLFNARGNANDLVALKTGDNVLESQTVDRFNELVNEAAKLWTKYAAIADGKNGDNHNGQSAKDYNHPRQWLNGLWFINRPTKK